METTKILSASFLDILFEGRNKEYGAYELRNTYETRMWKALGITLLMIGLIGGGAYLKNTYSKKTAGLVNISPDVTITAIPPEPEVEKLPPTPPPPAVKVEVPKVQTIKLTTPIVVDDKNVVKPPPTQTDLANSRISNITQEGIIDNGVVIPPQGVDKGLGIAVEIKKPDPEPDVPVSEVTTEASYLGGVGAWRSFLERNLRGDVPVQNGAESKNYTVIIQFVVDKEGNLSDIKPLTKLGFGMEEEAVRVIKKSGRWRPAVLHGKEVKAYRKQPITFQVLEP